MPVLVLGESNYTGPIEADTILTAKVTGVNRKETPFFNDAGEKQWKMEFAFVVDEPGEPHDSARLWGQTSENFVNNPNCKLYAWAQEILGTELEPGFALDTDFLVGNHCRIVVGLREYEKNGQPKSANFVADVMRAKGGSVYAAVDDEPF